MRLFSSVGWDYEVACFFQIESKWEFSEFPLFREAEAANQDQTLLGRWMDCQHTHFER